MEDDGNFSIALHRLQLLGVQFSIDDFGTGYSSIGYLRRFPVDEIKIDQSFIKGLGRDPFADALVKAVIMIGDAVGLRVVAEGVENIIQLTALRGLGGQHAQGYLFARPCELETCCAVIAEGRYNHHTRLGIQTSQVSALVGDATAS
jgi:EAL domain-containing protein (putative c-di-GMP-specific phosphodiesterase class I)